MKTRRSWWPLIVAIVILLGLLTSGLAHLTHLRNEMRQTLSTNMEWVSNQAHLETLKLQNALLLYRQNEATIADLLFRYDMLLSRVRLLSAGPQARALNDMGIGAHLFERFAKLELLQPSLTRSSPSTDTLSRLDDTLTELGQSLARASNRAMISQWEEAGSRFDNYRQGVLTVIILMAGIWLISGFLSLRLLQSMRKSHAAEKQQAQHEELQRQLEHQRRLNELYRNFGIMISHQFRTPLAIIDANMQRLVRTADRASSHDISHRAKKVRKATQRLNELIDRILQTTHDLETSELHVGQHSFISLAQQAINNLRHKHPERLFELLPNNVQIPMINCDPILTIESIDNLLTNAIKYSDSQTPIKLDFGYESPWVTCTVIDNGWGIPKHDQPHVFKRFYRSTATSNTPGTGVGLYLVNELIQLQGGRVQIDSTPGVGTRITLSLPAAA